MSSNRESSEHRAVPKLLDEPVEGPPGLPAGPAEDVLPIAPKVSTAEDFGAAMQVNAAELVKSPPGTPKPGPSKGGDDDQERQNNYSLESVKIQIVESLVPPKWRNFTLLEKRAQAAVDAAARRRDRDANPGPAESGAEFTAAAAAGSDALEHKRDDPALQGPPAVDKAASAEGGSLIYRLRCWSARKLQPRQQPKPAGTVIEIRGPAAAPGLLMVWLTRHWAMITLWFAHRLSNSIADPLPFQVLDVIAWQATDADTSSIGWLLKAQQAEAVARMRTLRRWGIAVGAVGAVLGIAGAAVAIWSWCVVKDRTGLTIGPGQWFHLSEYLWQYSLSATSTVLLCLAAATLLLRAALALLRDSESAFATSDNARRAEAALRLMRFASKFNGPEEAKYQAALLALGLEFGRPREAPGRKPDELKGQPADALETIAKIKDLLKT